MRVGWLTVPLLLALTGCATLGHRVQGETAGLTWQATDLVKDVERADLSKDRNPIQGRTGVPSTRST